MNAEWSSIHGTISTTMSGLALFPANVLPHKRRLVLCACALFINILLGAEVGLFAPVASSLLWWRGRGGTGCRSINFSFQVWSTPIHLTPLVKRSFLCTHILLIDPDNPLQVQAECGSSLHPTDENSLIWLKVGIGGCMQSECLWTHQQVELAAVATLWL